MTDQSEQSACHTHNILVTINGHGTCSSDLVILRSTLTYFVDNFLGSGIPSLKTSLLSCYGKFYESVRVSTSLEVRLVASIASKDIRSSTGSNLYGIRKLCNLDSLTSAPPAVVKEMLLTAKPAIPEQDSWRFPCLRNFLEKRHQLQVARMNTS